MSRALADDAVFIQRFTREARLLARLDHPNIVRCYDVGQDRGVHYLAMEYVDGESLQDWLDRLHTLSVGDSLHIVLACAEALQHAHEQNLIHRDIKPANVLLTRKGMVKLADLGLAKALSDDVVMTQTGTAAGTPAFMAPEQARDVKHVDGRCDIFALGAVLYCSLTGNLPFKGNTLVEITEAKEKTRVPPARRSNQNVPERLDLIIDKMMAPRVEQRYQTCAEVIRDLRALNLDNPALEFLTGEPASGPKAPARPAPAKTAAPRPASVPPAPKTPARPSQPPAPPEGASATWFLRYKASSGKVITQRMTTEQILLLIRSEKFNPHMQASHDLKTGYRELGTWQEFEQAVLGRVTRQKADRKTDKIREMYQQIEKEEERRQRWRWLRNLFRRFASGVALVFWLCVVVAGLVGIYFLIRYLAPLIGAKVDSIVK
jgi:serine/threonine-protein kinase